MRPGEGRTVAPALLFPLLAVGAMALSTIACDTLFVSAFSLGSLSRFFVVTSVVRVSVALAYGALARRWVGPRADAWFLVATSAMLACTGVAALSSRPAVVYVVCLLQQFLPPLLPLVAFNAVMSCFHARQAKRLLPLSAAAATVGSVAVSASAGPLAKTLGPASLLFVAAAVCLAALPLPRALARRAHEAGLDEPVPRTSGTESAWSALSRTTRDLGQVPVVRVVVAYAALGAIITNFVDFGFKAALKASCNREEMAAYLGGFNVVSNSLILAVQLLGTSRFVARFGVRAALSVLPGALSLLGPLTAALGGLGVGTLAKGTEVVLRYSLGGSVADLLLTPAPADVRTRAKVFVKGAAAPVGALVSGVVLAAFGADGPSRALLGAMLTATSLLLLVALRDARRAYTTALARAIGEGRITLDVSANAAAVLRSEIARHLARAVASGDTTGAKGTLALMGDRFFELVDVAPALASTDPSVRRAAIQAVLRIARPHRAGPVSGGRASWAPTSAVRASLPAESRPSAPPSGPDDGLRLLDAVPEDADLDVERDVLAAARTLGAIPPRERAQRALVKALAAPAHPGAVALWAEGLSCLALVDRDAAVKQLRKAALEADGPRRAAALRALGELHEKRAEREVLRAMGSSDAAVFAEASRTAVLIDAPGVVASLVLRLQTGPFVVAAGRALALAGPIAVNELLAALPTTRGEGAVAPTAVASGRAISGTVRAARVLARLGPEACARVLERFGDLGYRARNAVARSFATIPAAVAKHMDPEPVRRAMELTVAYSEALIAAYPSAGAGLLRREIAHRLEETGERVLDLASMFGERELIDRARAALATRGAGRRGHALELLENVLPGSLAQRIVAILEYEETARSPDGGPPRHTFDGWLEKCRLFDAKELALEAPMLGVLEKVLVLRDSSLFMGLSGEELYPVAEIAQPTFLSPGQVVIKQGDPGDALFVVAKGTVAVTKDDAKLREMGAGAVFGELALLDGAPRAATVVAVTEAQLLRIPRAEFEALLDESPELARGVIRTLIGHLRGGA